MKIENTIAKLIIRIISFLILLFINLAPTFSQELTPEQKKIMREKIEEQKRQKKERKEKLEKNDGAQVVPQLLQIEAEYKSNGEEASKKLAKDLGIELIEGNKIRVNVYLKKDPQSYDTSKLREYGCIIGESIRNYLEVDMPINMITEISEKVKGIALIDIPPKWVPDSYDSQGVQLTGATAYINAGPGSNGSFISEDGTTIKVKVAVFDGGFANN